MRERLRVSQDRTLSWGSVSPPVRCSNRRCLTSTVTDTFISKTSRLYRDSRSLTQGAGAGPSAPSSQLDQLNDNLKDVTRIMTKNMEDLLWRGDSLDRKHSPSGKGRSLS
jgi:hypothetical protein